MFTEYQEFQDSVHYNILCIWDHATPSQKLLLTICILAGLLYLGNFKSDCKLVLLFVFCSENVSLATNMLTLICMSVA